MSINPRVASIEASVIRSLNDRKKPTSIDLGMGEPTLFPTVRYFELATQWVAEHGCRYTTNAGDPELRGAIAEHYRYPQLNAAENVIATPGSQEGVYITIKALLDPAKDAMMVVEPAFPSYAKCAQMEGITLQRVALARQDEFAFDAERIAAAVTPQTRLIVLCSPCNPTARAIARAECKRLAELLLARGGDPIYVLHDEIYRELLFADDVGWFADVYPHTIVVNSLSKSNALTGMRMGWVLAPKACIPPMLRAHSYVVATANTFAQRIALEIFRTPHGLEEHAAFYREQRAGAIRALDEAGLRYAPIEGSFYAAVHVGDGVPTLAFAQRLIEEADVVAIPGSIFGASFEGWLRCSWVAPMERVREGFGRIARNASMLRTP
ncbi:MAG TPA: pyridoxal phosphate-dependent aminotransferase [Candidatus Acidoferrales bacterium]|nr:pyridoxal phosphate-dependent aminotransferase [Candidatus Acidoferrales bacterium]